ncbi:tyrosine-protein phosphatase [Jiangella alkaliphila]|uniref:Protein tyrosine/serine phosphatase n=1 Tax=Jiangella alkaliphila TaxID=419479 RepID=A0A1H2IAF7_9ACTN|nr:tyrosine-protein phosphatase [Jiangella alkaliphila]SDU41127.1 Protein tyrosine/serine phosphatase [Jiangella alkaliphila]
MSERWIDLVGAVNVRDLGGLPTTDGRVTRFGQVLRSDNLQDLIDDDIDRLTGEHGLRDVVDLRTTHEVTSEGPGPLTRVPDVTVHHLSLYPEVGHATDVEADSVLPWTGKDGDDAIWVNSGVYYTNYLRHRPGNVVAALRTMTTSDGSTLVHCAAGKDRTGVVCALALSVVGVDRQAVVDDYVQTGERIDAIMSRLKATATYAADLEGRPNHENLPRAESMDTFLDFVDTEFGGPTGWLQLHGWTADETAALRARLVG